MGQFNSTAKAESLECLLHQSYSIPSCSTLTSLSYNKQKAEKFRFNVNKNPRYKEGITCFAASLLDCACRPISKGIIEIKSKDLSFRYNLNGKLFVFVWPLNQIRWYGGNSGVFIFETGRLCKMGSTHFLFRCKRATKLVSALNYHVETLAVSQSSLSELSLTYKKDIADTSYIGSDFEHSMDFSSVNKLARNPVPLVHASSCQPNSPIPLDFLSYPQCLQSDRELERVQDDRSQSNMADPLNARFARDNQLNYNYLQIMPNRTTTGTVVTADGNNNTDQCNVDLEAFGQYLIALSTEFHNNNIDRNTTTSTSTTTTSACAAGIGPTRTMTINSHQNFSNHPCIQ